MGWSARVEACETFDAWARVCVAQTGKQNVYREFDGDQEYMIERGREQDDGSITGTVFRLVDDDGQLLAYRAGSFRIDPDGSVKRWPTKFKRLWEQEGAFAAQA